MTANPRCNPRVALYARTSTGHQDIRGQLEELEALAARAGWGQLERYVDAGLSGGDAGRPEYQRLRDDVRRRRVDLVAVTRFDRFARSTSELVGALEEFRGLGVDFVSAREAIDTSTPAGRALFAMIAAVAEFEREIIRERVLAGVARARQRGKRLGRPKRRFDLTRARELRAQGRSWRAVSKALGVPVSTLRGRLSEDRSGAERA